MGLRRALEDAFYDHPAFLKIWIGVGAPLVALFVTLGILASMGEQQDFRTLRGDLGSIHLPHQYRLTSERTTGSNCHSSCSVIQTWTWLPIGGRSASDQCRDASRALSSAYSDAEANSPLPPRAVCDYFVVASSFFHPGQGKRDIEAIVTRPGLGLAGHPVLHISASYLG